MQKKFDYNKDFSTINFRDNPHEYQVGRGEQGVLMVQPYKSEILPHWRFKNPEIAEQSAEAIYEMFLNYKKHNDFVGMDMARKFLQMGYTRSRRYANHATGKKYESNPQHEQSAEKEALARTKKLPQAHDWETNEKAQSARIFYGKYVQAREDKEYKELKKKHQEKYG